MKESQMVAIFKAISLKGTMTSIVLAVAGRQRWGSPAAGALLLFAVTCCGLAPVDAVASNVKFVGNAAYTYAGNVAVLTADEIRNFDSSGASGPLQLELWAIAAPFGGGAVTGYKLAEYTLGQLGPGFSYSNVSSGSVPFTPPPPGEWTFTIFVTEYTAGAPVDDGCLSVNSARNESYTYTACMHASGYLKR
jgi:hypothetical protein